MKKCGKFGNKDEINKLEKLIDYFQKIKAEFKTLDKY